MSHTINFLRELIAIDSVNPSLVAGAAGEENVALAVAAHMRESGMDVVVEDVRDLAISQGRCLHDLYPFLKTIPV